MEKVVYKINNIDNLFKSPKEIRLFVFMVRVVTNNDKRKEVSAELYF